MMHNSVRSIGSRDVVCIGATVLALIATSETRSGIAETRAVAHVAKPASANHYGLTISTGSTYNVTFDNGVFTATGDKAVLNVNGLESALAAGSVEVTTDNGSGGDENGDLHVNAALSWTTANGLTLDAYHSIFVDAAVTVSGAGPVALQTNDGGSGGNLVFQPGGNLSFASTANSLSINGAAFTLENSLPTLASAIAANAGGSFALANSYDASQDGNYNSSPISATLTGTIQGLGNTISNLAIERRRAGRSDIGLCSHIAVGGTVENMNVVQLTFRVSSKYPIAAGGLVGFNEGSVFNDFTSGSITVRLNGAGGLVGGNSGTVSSSRSSVKVKGSLSIKNNKVSYIGGLVGFNSSGTISLSWAAGTVGGHIAGGLVGESYAGTISESFATGRVKGGDYAGLGGLVGIIDGGEIENSYAEGAVSGGMNSVVGGFVGGTNNGLSTTSYSMGAVASAGGSQTLVGGFIGDDVAGYTTHSDYWDTTTSGTGQGVGNNQLGEDVTGLTSTQLQSGLPDGFDSAVWKEKKGVNHGFPFLIKNPPNK